MFSNQRVNATLPDAKKGTAATIECYLLEFNADAKTQNRLWTFQYLPQALKFKNSAEYAEQKTLSSNVPDQQFFATAGKTLSIQNILLDSYCLGKSLQPLLDGIEALLKAKLDQKIYAPNVLTFVFGTRRFSPCVLTDIDWNETAWLSGEAARVEMSMTLKEVPIDKLDKTATSTVKATDTKDGSPRIALTPRLMQDASKAAIANLETIVSKLGLNLQGIIKSKSYKVSTDAATGDVTMFDSKGNKIGTIGRYDGKKLNTDKPFFTLELNPASESYKKS